MEWKNVCVCVVEWMSKRGKGVSRVNVTASSRVSSRHRPLPALPPPPLPSRSTASSQTTAVVPFVVEDYLIATCHLSPTQALKSSKPLSHLKSPSKPDTVVAFLSGLGLSAADIAAAVTFDPKLLYSDVGRTLAPRLAELRDLGLSTFQIGRLVLVDPRRFRRPTRRLLAYYIPLFGSFENLLRTLRRNPFLLGFDVEGVVTPNVALLMECGLDACDIAMVSMSVPRLITTNLEHVRAIVERTEALGACTVAFLHDNKIAAKLLKKTFGWLDAEVGVAVSNRPFLLRYSEDRLRRLSEFLITQVGLEPQYIARTSTLFTYSLERRLMPRHYVVKFLKDNGLLEHGPSYYTAVQLSENGFMDKFIRPYKDAAPSLAQDYAAACRAQASTTAL
ncbi:LOW QUALITY PROTEIN: hypothetical protein U9M48_025787 [Paspalum notatum var. saurae]|uniref:Uncharacterized protein n=1 Tax=Paspalum notatum var. saurae TaxID=547442 RepID=A0AAQ3WYA3_PASNO